MAEEEEGEGRVVKRLMGGGLEERNSLRAEAQAWGSRGESRRGGGGSEGERRRGVGRRWGGGRRRAVRWRVVNCMMG